MAYYGEFDYERELIDDNWILPITGVFYNDIRANWLAKKVKDMDTSHMLYLAEGICSRIVCQVRNAYLNGFVTSYAVMPRRRNLQMMFCRICTNSASNMSAGQRR